MSADRRNTRLVHANALGYTRAGIERQRRNLTGNPVGAHEYALQDVSLEDPRYDRPSADRLYNSLFNHPLRKHKVIEKRNALIEPWMLAVQAELDDDSLPFMGELLYSPEINLDGVSPLFELVPGTPDDHHGPVCLFGLTMDGAGEISFYSSITAVELMRDVWPLYYAYYHRPAGAPAPFAGLTFGTPGGSPIQELPEYARWEAGGGNK